jgi:predicted enzyme related to lactoylglutathione lyase
MIISMEVTIDSIDPEGSAKFWEQALSYRHLYTRPPYTVLGPPDGQHLPRLVLQKVAQMTPGKTPVHLDLRVDDPDAEVARLKKLGASVCWTMEEASTRWTTMSDPFGVLFCVCPQR